LLLLGLAGGSWLARCLFGQDQPAQTRYLQTIDLALVFDLYTRTIAKQFATVQYRWPGATGGGDRPFLFMLFALAGHVA